MTSADRTNQTTNTKATAKQALIAIQQHRKCVYAVVVSGAWKYIRTGSSGTTTSAGGRLHRVIVVTTARSADTLKQIIDNLKGNEVLEFAYRIFNFKDVLGNALTPLAGSKLFKCGRTSTVAKDNGRSTKPVEESFECYLHAGTTTTDVLFSWSSNKADSKPLQPQ
jgi:hypothetical protein